MSKCKRFILCLIFTMCASSAFAGICTPNGINSFKVIELNHYPRLNKNVDLCLDEALFKQYPALLDYAVRATEVLNKISDVLGLSSEVLYPQGIGLRLRKGSMGNYNAYTDGPYVNMEQFSDWQGGAFDASLFAHEVGHAIEFMSSKSSPISTLHSLPMLFEGFCDLLAYVATGTMHSSDVQPLAEQFIAKHWTRDLTRFSTFNQSAGYFLSTDTFLDLQKLCADYSIADQTNVHVNTLCSIFSETIKMPGFVRAAALSSQRFSASICFDLEVKVDNFWGCDPHQLSLPLLNALVQMGKSEMIRLLRMLILPNESIWTHTFSCHYAGDQSGKNLVKVQDQTWENFFSHFRSGWSQKQNILWDQLSAQRSLSMGDDLGLLWQKKFILPTGRAQGLIRERYYATTPDDFYNDANPCRSELYNENIVPECKLICE